jgi:PP-loop superfamily ATP-utilizing enzyme
MAVSARRVSMRRFLEGLSTDELQYIAEYLGCRLLDPQSEAVHCDRNGLASDVERFQFSRRSDGAALASVHGRTQVAVRNRTDVAHKMILLLEYLSLSELDAGPVAWSGQGSA